MGNILINEQKSKDRRLKGYMVMTVLLNTLHSILIPQYYFILLLYYERTTCGTGTPQDPGRIYQSAPFGGREGIPDPSDQEGNPALPDPMGPSGNGKDHPGQYHCPGKWEAFLYP